MSDATVVKPRPGARSGFTSPKAMENAASRAVEADNTVMAMLPVARETHANLPGLNDNPLVDEAGDLLSIVSQIRCTAKHADIKSLRQACIDKIRHYEKALRRYQLDAETIDAARYCLCCLIDEAVLNTSWGSQSLWSNNSLLSTFHSQTWGGEHFFNLLDNHLSAARAKAALLELQYLCLSLGFVGKMRLEEQGKDKLEQYRQQIFDCLQEIAGEQNEGISVNSYANVTSGRDVRTGLPLWVALAVFGVLFLSFYMYFSYSINDYSDNVFNKINTLARWQSTTTTLEGDSPAGLQLQQRLQTEIDRRVLDVTPMSDRVRVTLTSADLFAAGSAEFRSAIVPVLQKLARALEATKGRILITGHTDDQPIFTSRYPSNWHLSLARATAVANTLATGTSLQGRLWPEGRGESEPRSPNDSEEARALNRRVEIDLLY